MPDHACAAPWRCKAMGKGAGTQVPLTPPAASSPVHRWRRNWPLPGSPWQIRVKDGGARRRLRALGRQLCRVGRAAETAAHRRQRLDACASGLSPAGGQGRGAGAYAAGARIAAKQRRLERPLRPRAAAGRGQLRIERFPVQASEPYFADRSPALALLRRGGLAGRRRRAVRAVGWTVNASGGDASADRAHTTAQRCGRCRATSCSLAELRARWSAFRDGAAGYAAAGDPLGRAERLLRAPGGHRAGPAQPEQRVRGGGGGRAPAPAPAPAPAQRRPPAAAAGNCRSPSASAASTPTTAASISAITSCALTTAPTSP